MSVPPPPEVPIVVPLTLPKGLPVLPVPAVVSPLELEDSPALVEPPAPAFVPELLELVPVVVLPMPNPPEVVALPFVADEKPEPDVAVLATPLDRVVEPLVCTESGWSGPSALHPSSAPSMKKQPTRGTGAPRDIESRWESFMTK